MVRELSIGVIGIQGAISEHIGSMKGALKEANTSGNVFVVKSKEEINDLDALLLPGGESTTISKELYRSGLHNAILKGIKEKNLPIMGTCAGCILLASEISYDAKDIKPLKAMEMQVVRNAFGRQKESFEKEINIEGFADSYNAVFIRAPIIKKIWG
ncbi:MAG: pyridoxal 5'-phosphate synthase glutaminase subunit PdxT, partial [Thermoplasmatales archaeon]|nr:pyridoxal 5'-phosphate synthase glutaminase subunit PdxT [Thermoplasmatales archaeon]